MRKLYVSLILLIGLIPTAANSKTYVFTGIGDWNDATHWKDRLIPSSKFFSDIVINGNVRYSSGLVLSTGSTLTVTTGSTFTLQADVLNCQCGDGGLWFEGATINVQAGATFNCKDWIKSFGTLNVDGSMNCTYAFSNLNTSVTTINGLLDVGVGGPGRYVLLKGPVVINSGGKLHINAGTIFESATSVTVNTGGILDHQGTIKGNTTIYSSVFANAATLSPGTSPGTISISGDYTPTSTANHIIELGGTSAGNFDQINVSGNVTLNGALNASLYGGFNPSADHDLVIMNANTISGTFSSVNVPAGYTVVYNASNVTLRFSGLLPVNFLDVVVKKQSNSIALITWKVGNEQNVSRYEVEKSTDGISFINIGSLTATGAPAYAFSDWDAQNKSFYRIKSVDVNNSYKYSPVVRIVGDRQTILLNSFPSPAINEIVLQHPSSVSKSKITIYSLNGQRLLLEEVKTMATQTKMNISHLPSGVYVVEYSNPDELQTIKIIKR